MSPEIASVRSSWSGDVWSTQLYPPGPAFAHFPGGSLDRFLQRLARHPTLQRSTLLRAFFESTEWVCFYNYSSLLLLTLASM